jgi:hypothetical protein
MTGIISLEITEPVVGVERREKIIIVLRVRIRVINDTAEERRRKIFIIEISIKRSESSRLTRAAERATEVVEDRSSPA